MTTAVSPWMYPTSMTIARRVGADHHREPIPQIPDPDWVAVRVEDVLLAQPVIPCGLGDDGLVHDTKLTWRESSRQRPHMPRMVLSPVEVRTSLLRGRRSRPSHILNAASKTVDGHRQESSDGEGDNDTRCGLTATSRPTSRRDTSDMDGHRLPKRMG